MWCLIIDIEKFQIILNMSWIEQHNVQISKKNRNFIFQFEHCIKNCIHNYRSTIIYNKKNRNKNKKFLTSNSKKNANTTKITILTYMKMINNDKNQIIIMWSKRFEMFNRSKKLNKYLIDNILIVDVVVITIENYDKFVVKIQKISIIVEQLKHKVFKRFH